MRNEEPGISRVQLAGCLVLAAIASASCVREGDPQQYGPGVGLCLEMIEAHAGALRRVEVRAKPHRGEARILFGLKGEAESAAEGLATCKWQRIKTGGLRLTSVVINGHSVPDLALLLRNADLLLQDLRASTEPRWRPPPS